MSSIQAIGPILARRDDRTGEAAAALTTGEYDRWENPPADLSDLIKRDKALTVEVKNRMGSVGCIRFSRPHPPFDNVAGRRLLLAGVPRRSADLMGGGATPPPNPEGRDRTAPRVHPVPANQQEEPSHGR